MLRTKIQINSFVVWNHHFICKILMKQKVKKKRAPGQLWSWKMKNNLMKNNVIKPLWLQLTKLKMLNPYIHLWQNLNAKARFQQYVQHWTYNKKNNQNKNRKCNKKLRKLTILKMKNISMIIIIIWWNLLTKVLKRKLI